MDETTSNSAQRASLPFILIAAVVQGWSLYFLHHAVVEGHWPATRPAWLLALYAIALFVPLTVQLLAKFARRSDHWILVGVMAAAYFYFGWHHGAAVSIPRDDANGLVDSGWFSLGIEAVVLWLMLLPFLQARLIEGRWNANYPTLFSNAWHNTLVLAEGALFTGLFWLLLVLWAALFHMLGIDFFRELFREPVFIYPVTALTLGIALHLIGSIDRLTSVVLEQVLNVLKWLAIVAGFILALFTLALIVKLPGLVLSGQRAIGAAWLLWLVAVIVLLLNAAYRDGTTARPYPDLIAQALRWIVPLTIIIALTAVYALTVRALHYGLTVERVWAFVVAGAAVVYSIGYTMTVFDRSGWLPGIARVNVVAALALMATIACALTPVLSPYRLAANSQFRMAQLDQSEVEDAETQARTGRHVSAFDYLRFDAGRYGLDRLNDLAGLQTAPEHIRRTARNSLQQKNRWQAVAPVDPDEFVTELVVFPEGRFMEVALADAVKQAVQQPGQAFSLSKSASAANVGMFLDLNGDATEEFILMNRAGGMTFERQDQEWIRVGRFFNALNDPAWNATLRDLERGQFDAIAPAWKELQIGKQRIRVVPEG